MFDMDKTLEYTAENVSFLFADISAIDIADSFKNPENYLVLPAVDSLFFVFPSSHVKGTISIPTYLYTCFRILSIKI